MNCGGDHAWVGVHPEDAHEREFIRLHTSPATLLAPAYVARVEQCSDCGARRLISSPVAPRLAAVVDVKPSRR
jgi:hypothetical protein